MALHGGGGHGRQLLPVEQLLVWQTGLHGGGGHLGSHFGSHFGWQEVTFTHSLQHTRTQLPVVPLPRISMPWASLTCCMLPKPIDANASLEI